MTARYIDSTFTVVEDTRAQNRLYYTNKNGPALFAIGYAGIDANVDRFISAMWTTSLINIASIIMSNGANKIYISTLPEVNTKVRAYRKLWKYLEHKKCRLPSGLCSEECELILGNQILHYGELDFSDCRMTVDDVAAITERVYDTQSVVLRLSRSVDNKEILQKFSQDVQNSAIDRKHEKQSWRKEYIERGDALNIITYWTDSGAYNNVAIVGNANLLQNAKHMFL